MTLPLILVLEYKWQLLFVCDRGSHIVSILIRSVVFKLTRHKQDIVESVDIRDTKGLIGIYTALTVLRTLASWVQSEYTTWFKSITNSSPITIAYY